MPPPRFILARYLLREHIGPFFFSSAIITLIFLLNLVFRELSRILSKGLPFPVVIEFFGLNMAWIIALSVPMAVLTATLMAFGRLAADNEITAMKATGISLYRIMAPLAMAATALAALLVWFNNEILPDMNHRTRLLASDIARKRPTVSLEPGVWFDDLANYGILVQSLEDSGGVTKAQELLIEDHSNLDLVKTVSAHRGYIYPDAATNSLVLMLFDGEMQEINIRKPEEFRRLIFPRHMISIPAQDMFLQRSDSEYRGDREKSVDRMRAEVVQLEIDLQRVKSDINKLIGLELHATFDTTFGLGPAPAADSIAISPATAYLGRQESLSQQEDGGIIADGAASREKRTASASATGAPSLLASQRILAQGIENHLSSIRSYQHSINSLLVEIHKKYSIPVACIVFVLIGAPLGVMTRRSGMAVSGGMSLGFFLLYWGFLIAGEDLADRQMLSPILAMWMANIIVGGLGLYLLIAVANERAGAHFQKLRNAFGRLLRLFAGHPKTGY